MQKTAKITTALLICLITLTVSAFGADERFDNPGYFVSSGFIGVGAASIHPRGGTRRNSDFSPSITGTYNIIQSEYGNIGLNASFLLSHPSDKYIRDGVDFLVSADEYSGDIGINYTTGSKTINYWLGGGYAFAYVNSELSSIRKNNVTSDFTKKFSDKVDGFYGYIGAEYVLTNDGKWGLYISVRLQDASVVKYNIDETIPFADGSTTTIDREFWLNVDSLAYTFGLSYHF